MKKLIHPAAVFLAAFWALASMAGGEDKEWKGLIDSAAKAAKKGDLQTAEQFLWQAAMKAEGFGIDDFRFAQTLNSLGFIALETGDYSKAKLAYGRLALAQEKQRLDSNDVAVATALLNLAHAECFLAETADAEQTLDRAQPKLEAKYGKNSAVEGACLGVRAAIARQHERWPEAEELYGKALGLVDAAPRPAVRFTVFGPKANLNPPWQPSVASLLNDQAAVYLAEQKWDKAESALRRAMPLFEWQMGRQAKRDPRRASL